MECIPMKNHSSSKYFTIFINLLLLFVTAKFLSLIALFFLPQNGIDTELRESLHMPYMHVNFKNMLQVEKRASSMGHVKTENALNLHTLILKGLYGNSHYGYAIIAPKTNPKQTTILSIGENYKGYTLKGVFLNYALFVKGQKEYKLALKTALLPDNVMRKQTSSSSNIQQNTRVSRVDINAYKKNPQKLWKDISIQELGKNGSFRGFKVTRLRKGSKLAALGLQVGDVIIKANNVVLKSYNDIINIFQNLGRLSSLSLVIRRGNIQKEIIYEIN